ncbi:putative smoothened-like [Apostichopus japonicus]|uniref:Putative smoothened-like n=1 Tax=Stichopus japonicus TaxID=307972 RepID=A0A2G8KYK1_STIJA|nr:putative smoothened-like [Apostichopus japonicus]
MYVLITLACHLYVFTNEHRWREGIEDYLYCRAEVKIDLDGDVDEEEIEETCTLSPKPNLAVMMIHIFSFFCAGITMSTWVWTPSSLAIWKRAWLKITRQPINEPQKLRKSRMIAKAFARKKNQKEGGEKEEEDNVSLSLSPPLMTTPSEAGMDILKDSCIKVFSERSVVISQVQVCLPFSLPSFPYPAPLLAFSGFLAQVGKKVRSLHDSLIAKKEKKCMKFDIPVSSVANSSSTWGGNVPTRMLNRRGAAMPIAAISNSSSPAPQTPDSAVEVGSMPRSRNLIRTQAVIEPLPEDLLRKLSKPKKKHRRRKRATVIMQGPSRMETPMPDDFAEDEDNCITLADGATLAGSSGIGTLNESRLGSGPSEESVSRRLRLERLDRARSAMGSRVPKLPAIESKKVVHPVHFEIPGVSYDDVL